MVLQWCFTKKKKKKKAFELNSTQIFLAFYSNIKKNYNSIQLRILIKLSERIEYINNYKELQM